MQNTSELSVGASHERIFNAGDFEPLFMGLPMIPRIKKSW